MRMTRLEICQRIREMAGITGSGPATTISQTGELGRVVNWSNDAWDDIQKRRLWSWLWEAETVTIAAGTYKTAGTIPAQRYVKDATYNAEGGFLAYAPWEIFRATYPLAKITEGEPTVWTIQPDKSFAVNAIVAADAVFSVERFRNPTPMTLDADVPGMPDEHHMLIVHRALMLYANFEEAAPVRITSEAEYKRMLGEMSLNELPDMTLGEALC